MKHFIHTLLTTAALVFCAVCFTSCNKDGGPNKNNPVEVSLPAAPFDLIVLDHEHGFNKDSNYVFEGVWKNGHFWFGREKLDTMQLNINPDNGIVLRVSSENSAFKGVNAASSSRCINIVQDGNDHRQYHLEWVAEGQSKITLWCGEGSSRKEIHFIATSKKEIPMTGIRFRVNGEEGLAVKAHYIPLMNYSPGSLPGEFTLSDYNKAFRAFNSTKTQYLRNDRHSGTVKLEIIGPEPLNATKMVLTTAFNSVSLQDHYAKLHTTNNGYNYDKNNEKWRHVLVWNKMYGLYEENLHCVPGFRWFEPFELERGCANDVNPFNYLAEFEEVSGWWINSNNSLYVYPKFSENDKYRLYPSDLRERYAELWPQPFCNWFPFLFYEGNKTYWYKVNAEMMTEETDIYYAFGIKFNTIDDYWNQYQNRHFWMENNPPYWEP